MASPAEVHILDYAGRHIGPIVGGGYDTGIPGSDFWTTDVSGELAGEGDSQARRISIRPADLSQLDSIILVGTDFGTFDFIFTIPDRLAGTQYKVAFIDVPIGLEEIYFLDPNPDTGFVLLSPLGEHVVPTEVSVIPLDLPVNLSIEGVASGHGMYQSDVVATLSASTRSYLPPIVVFEYDLGNGWQTYQEPLTFTTNGEHILRYRGIFEDGSYDVIQEAIFMIYRTNNPPIADAGPNQELEEGSTVTLSAAASMDPDDAPITFEWELISSTGPEVLLSSTTDIAPTFFAPDDGVYTFRVTVMDSKGATDEGETVVTVSNSAPFVEDITAPLVPVLINTMIIASAEFIDAGIFDDHSAIWNWGDGSTSPGIIVEGDGQGVVTGEHTYSEPSIYTIQLTVTDKDGEFGTSVFQYLVVYDPEGEFVTGGGWIDSPTGAYALDPSLVSKANFGFNAKYKNGATIPSGQTQFGLQETDFNFHSAEYEWLVFSGDQAQYQGTGTVNGEGGYGFLVSVIDGDVDGGDGLDRFRVKIWDLVSGEIVYDSQMGDPAVQPRQCC
jgi:PKD repeat protein